MRVTTHTVILRAIAVICLAALWQTAFYVAPGDGRIVPSLPMIVSALAALMIQPSTYMHVAISVAEIGGALFVGAAAATIVLLLSVRSIGLVAGVATLFYWLAPTLLLVLVNSTSASLLTVLKRPFTLLGITTFNMVLNAGLNLWVIPRWGFAGAAAATTAAEGCGMLLLLWCCRRALSGGVPRG